MVPERVWPAAMGLPAGNGVDLVVVHRELHEAVQDASMVVTTPCAELGTNSSEAFSVQPVPFGLSSVSW
ncbi:hypothetical protein [Amycolatopsis sp. NPDC098790]|uniref:hypothetical protein n=1 Tax=Amycolatopsis sp. NPDC098790 TaxID=3363939 RepID=UPI003801711C